MSTVVGSPVDEAKVEAFGERLVEILNGGGLAMMLSLGHRSGLFNALTDAPPSTSEQIAERSGLDERYVREWLGAMVTGRIVNYDPQQQTYFFPPEHAALLGKNAEVDFGSTMQWIAVLGHVEDDILDCFKSGGGIGYESFHRFHETMAEESAQTVVAALVDHILPAAEGIAAALTEGIDVLDVGCGSGHAMCRLAREFPHSRFLGYDFCADAIAAAQAEADRAGLANIRFERHDVAQLVDVEKFDLITAFDAIHDQACPDRVLGCIARALKPDGTFLMQDILASSYVEKNLDNPLAPFLYTISTMHCMTVSLAQNGAGLGTCWGRELAEKMLADAGFRHVEVKTLPHDDMNYYYIARKGG